MNILMVLDVEFPADTRIEKEIEALQEVGHTVTLLCYSPLGRKGPDTFKHIKLIRYPISKLQFKFKAISLLLPVYFNFWKRIWREKLMILLS